MLPWGLYLTAYLGTSSHISSLSLHLTSSLWGVYLAAYLGTSSHIWSWSLHLTSCGGISGSLSGYVISHLILVTSSDKLWWWWGYIWALHLKTWLFWMGSHWQHRSVKNSPSGTGSFIQGVDLLADLGIDLPNLNSSWPQDVSTVPGRVDLQIWG